MGMARAPLEVSYGRELKRPRFYL